MAMSMATGAMGSLLPKLVELLKDEYKLKESIKEGVRSLEQEMKSMQAALRKVGEVPRDQLDEQVKIWAREVRESFKMEDIVDKFLGKTRHEIADAIKSIKKQVQDVAERRARYNVDNIVASPPTVTSIDPRLGALYTEVTELVGIAGTRDQEVMKLISEGDGMSKKKLKIVSVVGFRGLGKTTLVKTVYENIKGDFNCSAFVSVGRNAEAKKVFMDILLDRNMKKIRDDLGMNGSQFIMLDEGQLIDLLRESLVDKRYIHVISCPSFSMLNTDHINSPLFLSLMPSSPYFLEPLPLPTTSSIYFLLHPGQKYLIVIDDIWDEKLWTTIKRAFSKANGYGSRLITTTRIVSVSKLCCSSTNDSVYQMKPLSDDDSKRLFHKRIFSQESGCPHEFEDVCKGILKKCGGVPLAIITIASILASDERANSLNEWHVLLESIGRGLNEDPSVEEMMRILSFSYYDLPSHLKTCLLYLSLFPEDSRIMKDQLIWMWIAESFVQCEKAETSLFEVGETYFNELVNKSLIQPGIVRRWSLQNARKEDGQTRPLRSESIGQASFVVLRVLDLDGYDGTKEDHLNLQEFGSLLHLRYLCLSGRRLGDLPEEIGKLQFLQVLNLPRGTRLPSTVIKLTGLLCLWINGGRFQPPDGFGNLRSMEVLSKIKAGSVSIVQELGSMHSLRELNIQFVSSGLVESFVKSLGKMQKIQRVEISAKCEREVSMDLLEEHWAPPASLREFIMLKGIRLSRLPAWNPYHLPQLSKLKISAGDVGQEDLGFLGGLPALRILWLLSDNQRPLLFSAEGFRCLKTISLVSKSPSQILFKPGALPKAEQVTVFISLRAAKDEAAGNCGDWFELGIENLPSLRAVVVIFFRSGVTVGEARLAKGALENAILAHPGSIRSIHIRFHKSIPEGSKYVIKTDDAFMLACMVVVTESLTGLSFFLPSLDARAEDVYTNDVDSSDRR
ncbi:hypothetical protein CFC21_020873 [Triticum aestivum]|uniref:NB-ARC domain-containing protein n=2 Tax=Triticum aestivum TaxID=4565 RepID=A0A3B6C038_WHEAT|nr:hypothetical protein CFC21_020873 [Triticum aestivum]